MFQIFKAEKKENWKTILGMSLEKIISFGLFNGKKKIKWRWIHGSKKMTENIKSHKTKYAWHLKHLQSYPNLEKSPGSYIIFSPELKLFSSLKHPMCYLSAWCSVKFYRSSCGQHLWTWTSGSSDLGSEPWLRLSPPAWADFLPFPTLLCLAFKLGWLFYRSALRKEKSCTSKWLFVPGT